MSKKILSSELVFDLIAPVTTLLEKIKITEFIKANKTTEKNKEAVGAKMIMFLLKNISKCKEEFFEVISIVEEITVEEAKKQSINKSVTSIKTVLNDNQLMEVFTSAFKLE